MNGGLLEKRAMSVSHLFLPSPMDFEGQALRKIGVAIQMLRTIPKLVATQLSDEERQDIDHLMMVFGIVGEMFEVLEAAAPTVVNFNILEYCVVVTVTCGGAVLELVAHAETRAGRMWIHDLQVRMNGLDPFPQLQAA